MDKNILGKISITGKFVCLTGLHIGSSKDNLEIGAIDASVVRDPVTRQPYVPGSSIKGKLRALLEKAKAIELGIMGETKRRNIGTKNNAVFIHVCDDADKAVNCPICRIFGSTGQNGGKNFPSRLIVRDAYLTEESVQKLSDIDTGLQYTEWKFENAIDRVTSSANPRQLERVPRGSEFAFELVYTVEDTEKLKEDIENIKLALRLLELDALGGHGSRGYGKVDVCIEKISIYDVNSIKTKTPKKDVTSLDEVTESADEVFQNS